MSRPLSGHPRPNDTPPSPSLHSATAASDGSQQRMTREPVDLLLRDLRTSRAGLGAREAAARLVTYGPNSLPRSTGHGWLAEAARQLTHPLALLLWGAAGLALLARTPTLSYAILVVILINAVVAFLQERQAARAIEALQAYLPPLARVVRDGVLAEVAATDLVPGDVLILEEGDRVSADARLIDGDLELDMSALTGESAPVARSSTFLDDAERLVDAGDAVFSGTSCTSGRARAVVIATGSHSEIGRIAALSQRATIGESPLERQVRRSAWLIAGVAIGLGMLFLPLGLLAGLSLTDAAVFAVGLLVANVPEGLLPTITLALAVGVRVLARRGALVKRLSAVETLGSTTVICTDKTGTLTQNQMAVQALWSVGDGAPRPGAVAGGGRLVAAIADCNEAEASSDPMERALRTVAHDLGERAAPQVAGFTFDGRRKRMSVVCRRGSELVVQVMGAPELLLPLCTGVVDSGLERGLRDADRTGITQAMDDLAHLGLRLIAFASRAAAAIPGSADEADSRLVFLGLVALLDPPRPEVAAAVEACHNAGIVVHVITGDNGTTAAEIARQVGIRTQRVVTGSEADAMTEPELDRLLATHDEIVFARSTPEGKLRIAEALQHNGEVVAMTGDGVNDAPALHRADIGVAMGRSGTDVAREASTMVLTDDNFATIVTAVREGRRAYDNLRKFVLYIFAHAVGEVVPFAVFALSAGHVPLPLTVLQILAIDLGTETMPALALGREEPEPDVMTRPPRPRAERLITKRLLTRAWLLMGSVSALLALGMFFLVLSTGHWHSGADVGPASPLHHVYLQATTATFLTLVACQVGTAFAARTERVALGDVGVFSNSLLLWGILGELAFAAALCYLAPFPRLFGMSPVPAWTLPLLLPCPILVWSVDELFRWFERRRHPTTVGDRGQITGAQPAGRQPGDRRGA